MCPRGHPDADGDGHSDRYADTDRHTYEHANPDRNTDDDRDAHTHCDSDRNTDADADGAGQ